jgi:hypothetical protein
MNNFGLVPFPDFTFAFFEFKFKSNPKSQIFNIEITHVAYPRKAPLLGQASVLTYKHYARLERLAGGQPPLPITNIHELRP